MSCPTADEIGSYKLSDLEALFPNPEDVQTLRDECEVLRNNKEPIADLYRMVTYAFFVARFILMPKSIVNPVREFRLAYDMDYIRWYFILRDFTTLGCHSILRKNFSAFLDVICSMKHTSGEITNLPTIMGSCCSIALVQQREIERKNIRFSDQGISGYHFELVDSITMGSFLNLTKDYTHIRLSIDKRTSLVDKLRNPASWNDRREKFSDYEITQMFANVVNSVVILDGQWSSRVLRLFKNLKILCIDIEPVAYCPPTLEELYIRKASIFRPEVLAILENLKYLSIEDTNCEKFPPNIEFLHCANITIPDDALCNLTSLRKVYFQNVNFAGRFPPSVEILYADEYDVNVKRSLPNLLEYGPISSISDREARYRAIGWNFSRFVTIDAS